jgi:hypothetical protein
MKTTDFSRTLIRCSSIGQIMTSPQGKSPRQKWLDCKADIDEQEKKFASLEERLQNMATGKKIKEKIEKLKAEEAELFKVKDIEPLSQTCKTYLTRVYAEVKYGKGSMQQMMGNKYTDKGKLVEEDGIDLICLLDRRMLRKNDKRITNDFLTGEPDLYLGDDILNAEYVWDVKCPYDICSYMDNIGGPLNPDYFFQLQGYMALTNAPAGEVNYCLVNAPASMIEEDLYRLSRKMDAVTGESPEFLKAKKEYLNNMTFDEIDPEERRLRFPVERDNVLIDKIYQKVEKCREYLSEIERMHLAHYEIPQLLNAEAL